MAETQVNSSLGDLLESIKDYDLNKKTYAAILKYLEAENRLKSTDFENLLTICLHEYNKRNTFAISSLRILSSLLKKTEKEHNNTSGLLALLVAVLNHLKVNASVVKISALKLLCFEIVMLFPDECLIKAAGGYSNELYIVVEQYCQETSDELVEKLLVFTLKLFQILPAVKKSKFVKDGINTWFSSLIPTVFNIAKENSLGLNTALQLFETLSKELLPEDYVENKHFKTFVSNLPSQYVPIILNILNEAQDHWASLWISTVTLLKVSMTASSLNALLQVEESAFKNDPKHRCLAFECWKYFIDNFSSQSPRILNKRIKLLAVPLLSFNAKSEETAFVKIGTWWHFFLRLSGKCDVLVDYIEPFLTFCFGSPPASNQPSPPATISARTKRLGIQALANILGPCACDCSWELERLTSGLVTPDHLLKNNKNWIHYFSFALDACVDSEGAPTGGALRCAWTSYLRKACALPDDAFRNEGMFRRLLDVLEKALQKCCFKTSEIIINELIPAIFALDEQALAPLVESEAVFRRIQGILTDACNNNFYSGCNIDETTAKIGAYTDYAIDKSEIVGLVSLLEGLPSSEAGVLLWTCFVESTIKYKYFSNSQWIVLIMMWPIRHNIVSNIQRYISTWMNFYDFLNNENIRNDSKTRIIHTVNDKLLLFLSGNKSVRTPLRLTSIVCLIEQDLSEKGADPHKPEHLILKILMKQMSDELVSPATYWRLLDCLRLLFDVFVLHKDTVGVKKLLLITNTTLKVTPKILSTLDSEEGNFLPRVEMFLKNVYDLIKIEEYSKSGVLIVEGMKQVASHLSSPASALLNRVKQILSLTVSHEDKEMKSTKQTMPDVDVKETHRKTPSKNVKKCLSIVNTVVENGEEFVQVETNWKFNPKKMTENQKEKLQRKREDIPALYQDYSQSQDEIKLGTWKADPDDTTSSSKSAIAPAAVLHDALRVAPSPPGLPHILPENKTSDSQLASAKNSLTSDTSKATTPKTKDSNSSRILLKDRVTRNVRNLAEKACLSKDYASELVVVCEKLPNTLSAASKYSFENAIYSAGSPKEQDVASLPKLSSSNEVSNSIIIERPLRKSKTPIKYIHSKVFAFKKRTSQYTNPTNDDPKLADEATVSNGINSPVEPEEAPHRDKRTVTTPKHMNEQNTTESSSKFNKKSSSRESRIQKLLAIDMVEPTVSIVRINDGPYATRNKSKMTQAKSTDNETQPEPDSASQDIIESSQDSSVTAVSAISTKINSNKVTVPSHSEDKHVSDSLDNLNDTLFLGNDVCESSLHENKAVLPPNVTAEETDSEVFDAQTALTELMDTEPADSSTIENEWKFTEIKQHLEPITQSTAEADTKLVNFTVDVIKEECIETMGSKETEFRNPSSAKLTENAGKFVPLRDAQPTVESMAPTKERDEASSPLKDDDRRRKDFLDDTLEISPIKTMSPLTHERTPSPETSGDYVVINLTSSVLLNGEPVDSVDSPEVFTADKLSPDAREASPSRAEWSGSEGNSGSGLSLKMKTRVRPTGRAAQMLGLCVDGEADPETAASAKRSLKRSSDVGSSDEAEDGEPFLRLRRILPAVDSSPGGPILKRKHAEIAEDATPSPAGKRKRVSFHDPPVSTSVCVKKYIDSCAARSPQSSAPRRADRPLFRPPNQTPASQRRLDKILAKTVESILSGSSQEPYTPSGRTPTAEVVNPLDLDDCDPIFPRLARCEDPVDSIASDLSAPDASRSLAEALEGKIATVGDLARLTEAEVNRLRIKWPKVETAKTALKLYWDRLEAASREGTVHSGSQTDAPEVASVSAQTDERDRTERTVQTGQSGNDLRESDVVEYISANPKVLMALDERNPEATRAAFVDRWLRDKEKMADFVVALLRERFEVKEAVAFWCDILKTITDGA